MVDAALVVDAADATGVLAPTAGVVMVIPSVGLGEEEEAMVEDTLMTGLLMTDTVLVVEPCNGAAVVTVEGVGKEGRLLAGATEASAVVTGISPFAISLVSCRPPSSRLSLSLSRA